MKNRFVLTLMATLICSTLAMAQLQKLPAPAKTGGKPVMEALWSRASGTEFSDKMLSDQDLSNLLFAAIGVNRPANGKLGIKGTPLTNRKARAERHMGNKCSSTYQPG